MSTIRERSTNKIPLLLKQDRKLFHTKDLKLLWNIQNPATLRATISRYIKRGVLTPVYRGFYSVVPLNKINPLELGVLAIHDFAYLSTETVLSQHGIIFQEVNAYTFCSVKPKRFEIQGIRYHVRQLRDQYLYNVTGIIDKGTYKIASTERAVADILYYNPKYHFDATDLLNWDVVHQIQKELGYS